MANGKNGIASMIQVCANSSMERDYLYSQRTTSLNELFKAGYKHHTHFDKEPMNSEEKRVPLGGSAIFEFDNKRSEMIGNLILRITVDTLPSDRMYVNDLGTRLIDTVRILNGDRELVSYTGHYLLTHHLLNTSKSKVNGVNRMIGHYNTKYSLHGNRRTLYVPLPFMREQFYPLFLSQLHVNVKLSSDVVSFKNENIRVRFGVRHDGSVRAILSYSEPVAVSASVCLLFDAIHLSRDERLLFGMRKGELLFQSIQQKTFPVFLGDTTVTCLLDFTGTANHLIVTMNYKKINRFRLLINGVLVNADTDANVYRYFNNSLAIKGYVYVIPFALDCVNPQPSGAITFYGRKNTVLMVNRDPGTSEEIQIVGVMLDSMHFENGLVF
jgi:hypothetical protein